VSGNSGKECVNVLRRTKLIGVGWCFVFQNEQVKGYFNRKWIKSGFDPDNFLLEGNQWLIIKMDPHVFPKV